MLGGPIQNAIHPSGKFDICLSKNINILFESISSRHKVLSAHISEDFGKITPCLTSDEIAQRDFHWVMHCDLLVTILPNDKKNLPLRTDGTFIEIGWASAMKKPILILPESPLTYMAHSHLLRGLACVARVKELPLAIAISHPEVLLREIHFCINEAVS